MAKDTGDGEVMFEQSRNRDFTEPDAAEQTVLDRILGGGIRILTLDGSTDDERASDLTTTLARYRALVSHYDDSRRVKYRKSPDGTQVSVTTVSKTAKVATKPTAKAA